jgi:ribosomal protein L11 methyltransferase
MPPKPRLWSVTFTVPQRHADAFADVLGERAAALTVLAPPRAADAKIEALFDAPPDRAALTAQLAIAAMLHGMNAPRMHIRELPSLDWLEKVAADFPPLPIARWIIFGARHKAAVTNPRRGLQIDATSAFGTGEHPTTRGCLLMLDKVLKNRLRQERRRAALLDMGCGTGILAMAWAKAAHGKAVAVDIDPVSVDITKNNLRANGLRFHVRAVTGHGYASRTVRQGAPYDLIMANIFARPLAHMAKDLKRHLRPGGIVILSGLLNHQANTVIAAHRMQGLHLKKRLRLGEWSVLALERRPMAPHP